MTRGRDYFKISLSKSILVNKNIQTFLTVVNQLEII